MSQSALSTWGASPWCGHPSFLYSEPLREKRPLGFWGLGQERTQGPRDRTYFQISGQRGLTLKPTWRISGLKRREGESEGGWKIAHPCRSDGSSSLCGPWCFSVPMRARERRQMKKSTSGSWLIRKWRTGERMESEGGVESHLRI